MVRDLAPYVGGLVLSRIDVSRGVSRKGDVAFPVPRPVDDRATHVQAEVIASALGWKHDPTRDHDQRILLSRINRRFPVNPDVPKLSDHIGEVVEMRVKEAGTTHTRFHDEIKFVMVDLKVLAGQQKGTVRTGLKVFNTAAVSTLLTSVGETVVARVDVLTADNHNMYVVLTPVEFGETTISDDSHVVVYGSVRN